MKAAIHVNHARHQQMHATWIAEGLLRHGIASERVAWDEPASADFAVMWGWRQKTAIAHAREIGMPVLVMERGYIGDRLHWTSMGWDGLNGRARFPDCHDGGERFGAMADMKPWREGEGEAIVLFGQVPGDASIKGRDYAGWLARAAKHYRDAGLPVIYRPHPGDDLGSKLEGAELSREPLARDLQRASVAVTFNSNSGVDAVLAGVPTVACDEGAMAWPVAAHNVGIVARPPREDWAHRLAWCQWSPDEIASGEAWEVVSTCMDA